MDLRESFSKPFKKLRNDLPGGARKRDGRRSGSKDTREGRGVDFTEGEASQSNSYLHPEVSVEGAAESEPTQERSTVDGKTAPPQVVDVDPLAATPLISHIGEPDSMCEQPHIQFCL